MEIEKVTHWLTLALVLVAALGLFLWSNTPYDIDDAPITYRYAENLAAGNGFVYNVGERILGTSTPLYTLMLAAMRLFGVSIPVASNALNLIASIGVIAVTMALVNNLSKSFWAAVLSSVFVLMQGSFLRHSMAGMETPVYTLLIMSSLLAFAKEKAATSAFLAGLASVMRLDGLAIAGAVLLSYLIKRKQLPWTELAVFIIPLVPWVLFSTLYFGSPIPLSMLAKQEHLRVLQHSRFWIWDWLFVRPLLNYMYLLPFILIGLVWALSGHSGKPRWLVGVIWLMAYLIEYTLVGIDFYEWYLMPAYPVLACLAAVGFSAALDALSRRVKWTPRVRGLTVGVVLIGLVFPYIRNAYGSVKGQRAYLLSLEKSRVLAGTWLRNESTPESMIRTGAIGHVGYESQRYIIDSAGLITPRELATDLVADYHVLAHPFESTICGPVKDFDTGWPDYPRLTISRCSEVKGTFDTFVLAEVRATNWVLDMDGEWHRREQRYLETQWLLKEEHPDQDWTLYVHLTQPDGTIVAQADHLLGRRPDGSYIPTTHWPVGQRIYDYVPFSDELQSGQLPPEVRIGIWDPTSEERLTPEAVDAAVDEHQRLVIDLPE